MARNKYPEETEQRILQTSHRLFLEKGYDDTSIQDIINQLGGLSKGAIYHHFKSKEDILLRIMEEMDGYIEVGFSGICRDSSKNGFEKLQALFQYSLLNTDKETAFLTSPNLMKNPRMLAMQIDSIFREIVPQYILPVIEEGIADGSIETEYPRELAEVIIILSNIWLNPLMIGEFTDLNQIMRNLEFYRLIFKKLNVCFIDDEMMEGLRKLCERYYDRAEKRENS